MRKQFSITLVVDTAKEEPGEDIDVSALTLAKGLSQSKAVESVSVEVRELQPGGVEVVIDSANVQGAG